MAREKPYRRVGDTAKCPACGTSMDPQAYRCPKCRIYFCFKCRVRVPERAPQFQCADQSCEYYGKLLCQACTVMVEQELPQEYWTNTRTRGKDGHVVKIAIGGVVVGGATLFFAPVTIAAAAAAAAVVGGGILVKKMGGHVFSNKHEETYTLPKPTQYTSHRCCIACKHPVENM
jgi:hypothetical protein